MEGCVEPQHSRVWLRSDGGIGQSSLRDERVWWGSVRRGGWVETHGYHRLTLCGRNDGRWEPNEFGLSDFNGVVFLSALAD